MTDYIGKYVKKFESGSAGSLALGSCGNDWGLSCGSYQLTLRWGNCINFLTKYFPSESTGLFFNTSMKDFASKTWPGSAYCSSPDAVKSVWQKCYNKVGAEKFFECEHAWIEAQYYIPVKTKVKPYLDLDTCGERAFQECFWSWSVHKGSAGAFNAFKEVLASHNITSLDCIDKEFLFDAIYDQRYAAAGTNRYKKGLMNGDSERETLRPLLHKGTFSGKDPSDEKEDEPDIDCVIQDNSVQDTWDTTPVSGTIKVILRDDTLNIRKTPSMDDNIKRSVSYGAILTVIGKVKDRDFYELDDGSYISSNDKYVQFTPTTISFGFDIRIKASAVGVRVEPTDESPMAGVLKQNMIFNIVEEKNGYGRLKSGAGWISMNPELVKRLS